MKWTLTVAMTAVLTLAAAAAFAEQTEQPDNVNTTTEDSPDHVVIGGADRYETAAQIALNTFPAHPAVLYIANGETVVDALAIGVTTDSPSKMLFVTQDTVPAATSEALSQLRTNKVVFLGGDGAISPAVRDEVMATVGRLSR